MNVRVLKVPPHAVQKMHLAKKREEIVMMTKIVKGPLFVAIITARSLTLMQRKLTTAVSDLSKSVMERKGLAAAAPRTSLVSLVVEIVMMIQSAPGTSYVVTTTAGTFTPMQALHMIVAKLDQVAK